MKTFFTYLKVAALVASLALSVKYCSFKDTPSTLRSAIPQDTVFVHDTIHWFNTVYDTIYKTKYYQKWNFDSPNVIYVEDSTFHWNGDTSEIKYSEVFYGTDSISLKQDTFNIENPIKDNFNVYHGSDTTTTYTLTWNVLTNGTLESIENYVDVKPEIRIVETEKIVEVKKRSKFWNFLRKKENRIR